MSAETAAERGESPSEAAGLRGAKARRRRRLAGKEPGRPWPARRQARRPKGSAASAGKQGVALALARGSRRFPSNVRGDRLPDVNSGLGGRRAPRRAEADRRAAGAAEQDKALPLRVGPGKPQACEAHGTCPVHCAAMSGNLYTDAPSGTEFEAPIVRPAQRFLPDLRYGTSCRFAYVSLILK